MHLVEISTKSTKNMGYAQVTQSPFLGVSFLTIFDIFDTIVKLFEFVTKRMKQLREE